MFISYDRFFGGWCVFKGSAANRIAGPYPTRDLADSVKIQMQVADAEKEPRNG